MERGIGRSRRWCLPDSGFQKTLPTGGEPLAANVVCVVFAECGGAAGVGFAEDLRALSLLGSQDSRYRAQVRVPVGWPFPAPDTRHTDTEVYGNKLYDALNDPVAVSLVTRYVSTIGSQALTR